jgi:hypothetical protein
MGVEQWIQKRRFEKYLKDYDTSESLGSIQASIARLDSIETLDQETKEALDQYAKKTLQSNTGFDEELIAYIRAKVRERVKEQTRRLRFVAVYEDIKPENAQIYKRSETDWIVVLPKTLQDTLDGGPEHITKEMIEANDKLRELTMHELAHVIIEDYWKNEGMGEISEEEEHEYASELAQLMIKKKLQRNERIRDAQIAFGDSQLNRLVYNKSY